MLIMNPIPQSQLTWCFKRDAAIHIYIAITSKISANFADFCQCLKLTKYVTLCVGRPKEFLSTCI